jgi:hypothetical protein
MPRRFCYSDRSTSYTFAATHIHQLSHSWTAKRGPVTPRKTGWFSLPHGGSAVSPALLGSSYG